MQSEDNSIENNYEKDKEIIKNLVNYGKNKNSDDFTHFWMNCYLHNANIKEFSNREEYEYAVKNDNEFLFKFLIILSFERYGFEVL